MTSDDPAQRFEGPEVPEAYWVEWKAACTIGKCSPNTADALARLARNRLRRPLTILASELVEEYCLSEKTPRRAWLALEAHLYAGRQQGFEKDGKRYKDYLLTEGRNAAKAEAIVTTMIRTELCRRIVLDDAPGGDRDSRGRRVKAAGGNGGDEQPRTVRLAPETAVCGDESDESDLNWLDVDVFEQLPGWQSRIAPPKDASASALPEGGGIPSDAEGQDGAGEETAEETLVLHEDESGPDPEFEPETDADADEMHLRAEQLSQAIWNGFSDRERIALLLLVRGISQSDFLRTGRGDCGKSQLSDASRKVRSALSSADWGVPLGLRQRVFLTRALCRALLPIAETWLSTSEFREVFLSMIVEGDSRDRSAP